MKLFDAFILIFDPSFDFCHLADLRLSEQRGDEADARIFRFFEQLSVAVVIVEKVTTFQVKIE
mgnify:CR=1 FL=1